MLLQVVSVIVAPFGITRIASAVENCSDGPWAVALVARKSNGSKKETGSYRAAFRIVSARWGVLLLSV